MRHLLDSWAVKFLISIWTLFAPIHPIMWATISLISFDFVTGCTAALRRGEKLSSRGFKVTVLKTGAYVSTICVCFVMQHYLMNDSMPVVNIAGTMIALTEGKSCLENVESITGISVVKYIMSQLKVRDGEDK